MNTYDPNGNHSFGCTDDQIRIQYRPVSPPPTSLISDCDDFITGLQCLQITMF